MGLLAMLAQANPGGGYAPDFIPVHLGPCLAEIARQRVRVVVNAGGVNPHGCAAELARVAAEQGLSPRIAVVDGDDLMGRLGEFRAAGVRDTGIRSALYGRVFFVALGLVGALGAAAIYGIGAHLVVDGAITQAPRTVKQAGIRMARRMRALRLWRRQQALKFRLNQAANRSTVLGQAVDQCLRRRSVFHQ